jgi:arginyl-tRNA synthetase
MSNPTHFPQLLTDLVRKALEKIDIPLEQDFRPEISLTADPKFGHYQTNAAMVLAAISRQNPRSLADRIVKAIGTVHYAGLEVAGPGFINFHLSGDALGEAIAALFDDPRLGATRVGNADRIVIDYSSPNIAKPMHVGHIRSTIIGDSLARIARFLGHEVIADNHIGDWGTQFGMILHGWKTLLDQDALEDDPIGELVRCYREVSTLAKSDPETADAARQELVALQAGDPENTRIWQQCVELSKAGLKKIYDRLDIHFDTWLGESAYNDRLAPLVDALVAEGIATPSDGALCVFFAGVAGLEKKPAIIRKSDGGFNYTTTDLATIDHRAHEQGATKIWYVVGAPQQLHFRELFEIARRRGIGAQLSHISFGSILQSDPENPDAPPQLMRTREGRNVGLVEVLEEAVERARATVDDKNPELPETEKATIAEAIGIGSVKYFELSHDRSSDYVFSWEGMLSQQGNTAPYLMYSYVRTRSIFRKLDENLVLNPTDVVLTEPSELALAFKLTQFGDTVAAVLDDHRPHTLSSYLYELARQFHGFFETCPVLRSEGTTRNTRLILCDLTARVLAKGLELLGIRPVERM